jgi:hypothetical protein
MPAPMPARRTAEPIDTVEPSGGSQAQQGSAAGISAPGHPDVVAPVSSRPLTPGESLGIKPMQLWPNLNPNVRPRTQLEEPVDGKVRTPDSTCSAHRCPDSHPAISSLLRLGRRSRLTLSDLAVEARHSKAPRPGYVYKEAPSRWRQSAHGP